MAVLLLAIACTTTGTDDRTRLTAAEVRATFIDRPWRSPSGTFLFRSDGTYTYQRIGQARAGPWNYTLRPDGVIEGANTNYTFYRNPDGSLVYHHSRSGRFIRATLGP
ncbi:hypothetical protein [Sphingopyxis sp.]|uniref:hypothetical protein n=1 Tax=Sphingopyxis sp. TaxID=1908224 RepID=UPI0032F05141